MNFENDPIPAFDFGVTHTKYWASLWSSCSIQKNRRDFPKDLYQSYHHFMAIRKETQVDTIMKTNPTSSSSSSFHTSILGLGKIISAILDHLMLHIDFHTIDEIRNTIHILGNLVVGKKSQDMTLTSKYIVIQHRRIPMISILMVEMASREYQRLYP